MNERGFLPASPLLALILLLVAFAIVIIGPVIAIHLSPVIRIIFQFIIAVTIYNWVKNTVGPGVLSLVISGVLIYIFVIMLPGFTAALWATYYILGLGIASMLIWGFTLFSGRM